MVPAGVGPKGVQPASHVCVPVITVVWGVSDGVEDAMGLARWSVVEGLRALEAQVKGLRHERDR